MTWDEWEQLKADTAGQNTTQMRLNQLDDGNGGRGGPGTGPAGETHGDLQVSQKSLAAIGDEAYKLFDRLERDGKHAKTTSTSAATVMVDARVERDKMIAGLATGGMFSLMPSPASGVAATVVPIVSDGVEGVTGGLIEANLDKYAESPHRDNAGTTPRPRTCSSGATARPGSPLTRCWIARAIRRTGRPTNTAVCKRR
ncbi:hypothetical protein [Streptomyces sp. NPDC020681]|uniref:hypothetical protein n=1 Tax=Streptomyces sp. NPDC020681 TaxID=3365083 RepID=UPI0037911F71